MSPYIIQTFARTVHFSAHSQPARGKTTRQIGGVSTLLGVVDTSVDFVELWISAQLPYPRPVYMTSSKASFRCSTSLLLIVHRPQASPSSLTLLPLYCLVVLARAAESDLFENLISYSKFY